MPLLALVVGALFVCALSREAWLRRGYREGVGEFRILSARSKIDSEVHSVFVLILGEAVDSTKVLLDPGTQLEDEWFPLLTRFEVENNFVPESVIQNIPYDQKLLVLRRQGPKKSFVGIHRSHLAPNEDALLYSFGQNRLTPWGNGAVTLNQRARLFLGTTVGITAG